MDKFTRIEPVTKIKNCEAHKKKQLLRCQKKMSTIHHPSCDVLVIGLANSGKTFLCKQMSAFCKHQDISKNHFEYIPSVGVNLEEIEFEKKKFTMREVGGNLLSSWNRYITDCNSILVSTS